MEEGRCLYVPLRHRMVNSISARGHEVRKAVEIVLGESYEAEDEKYSEKREQHRVSVDFLGKKPKNLLRI